MHSDVASNELVQTNSLSGRSDDWRPQISCRFGIIAETHGQANDHLLIVNYTVKDF